MRRFSFFLFSGFLQRVDLDAFLTLKNLKSPELSSAVEEGGNERTPRPPTALGRSWGTHELTEVLYRDALCDASTRAPFKSPTLTTVDFADGSL